MAVEAATTQVVNSVLAPLYDPIGVQGLAYGLLGLKTIRTVVSFARSVVGENEQ